MDLTPPTDKTIDRERLAIALDMVEENKITLFQGLMYAINPCAYFIEALIGITKGNAPGKRILSNNQLIFELRRQLKQNNDNKTLFTLINDSGIGWDFYMYCRSVSITR